MAIRHSPFAMHEEEKSYPISRKFDIIQYDNINYLVLKLNDFAVKCLGFHNHEYETWMWGVKIVHRNPNDE